MRKDHFSVNDRLLLDKKYTYIKHNLIILIELLLVKNKISESYM